MNETLLDDISDPRIEARSGMSIIGLRRVYGEDESAAGIPNQWQEFVQHIGHIPNQKNDETYGVCHMTDNGLEYICGVEVTANDDVPKGLHKLELGPQNYAVFQHDGHISTIRRTWATIFQKALPEADFVRADAPDFEWYSSDFDPISGTGRIEIWIPLKLK